MVKGRIKMKEKLTKMEQQVILYSKNWFERTELLNDLRVFVSKAYRIDLEHMYDYSVYHFITQLWFKLFDYDKAQMIVRELFKSKMDINYKDIIETMMSDFANLRVYDKDGIEMLELGEPDYGLLPKRKEE
jgi:hypothetical protein